ncbi:MAG TPA: fructose-bisphosphatase class II, partial [Acidothermaceae bacterium]
ELVRGVRYRGGGAVTSSLVMRSKSGTIRTIESEHQLSKLRGYAIVDYDHRHADHTLASPDRTRLP